MEILSVWEGKFIGGHLDGLTQRAIRQKYIGDELVIHPIQEWFEDNFHQFVYTHDGSNRQDMRQKKKMNY